MQRASKRAPQWLRDLGVFILVMGGAVGICMLLSACYDDNNPFATSVFILAVVLISRFTNGYLPGVLAAAVGVVGVNYLFTYPFHEFNLSIDGYPLTFAVMLVVSVLVSTLTTQIKRQEQLRYEAEKDRMRVNLLRSVSHDIRTPLAAIMGLSATVEEGETLTDEGRGMVEEIRQNAQWLLHLSENILSVTRFSEEGVVIEKSDEVVEEIVGSAIRRFRKNCGTDIPIAVTKPEEILLVPMDATLIEQVLLNLLENVARHSPSATEIFIEIRDEGSRVWLTVADNGDGIPPQLLGVLFDGYLPLGAVEDDRLLADVFVWQTEDFVYLEHFAVQPSLRGQGTGSRILRELLQGEKPFILEIEPPEDALTCRRKAFYERNGLQAQPYDHVQLPFQGGGPIVPLVIMADRAISPAQCRTFQRYLLDRVVKYTQYGK